MKRNNRFLSSLTLRLLFACALITVYSPSSSAGSKSTGIIPSIIATEVISPSGLAGSVSVSLNHRTNKIYVANQANGTVSVFDGGSNALISTIPIDSSAGASGAHETGPCNIVVDENYNLIYVITNNGVLATVDGNTNIVLSSFVFDTDNTGPEGFSMAAAVLSTKTGKLYVSNTDIQVDVIDPVKQQVLKRLPDNNAYILTIDQAKNLIYVLNVWHSTISVIDGNTDQFTSAVIPVGRPAVPWNCFEELPTNAAACTDNGSHPDGLDIDAVNHKIYVGLQGDSATAVVDIQNNILIDTLPVGGFTAGVDTQTHAVYTLDANYGYLGVINGLTDQIVANGISIATGFVNPNIVNFNTPQGIAVDASRGKIYVADFGLGGPDQLLVLKTGVQPNITITSTPSMPGLNLGGSYSYQVVANSNDGLPVTYSLKGQPAGMKISANGLINWTPIVSGAFKYTVIATDPNGVSAKQTVNVTVCAAGKNWAPSKGGVCMSPTAIKTGR